MALLEAQSVSFAYGFPEDGYAIQDISLHVTEGEYIAILGANGSGKSTLCKVLGGLLSPTKGHSTVAGLDISDPQYRKTLPQRIGMVFQNPDSQFVSPILEEDTAFGPRNTGIPEEDIPALVQRALHTVGLDGFERRSPHTLSGGQKQRAAIAGVLAASPSILLFDEATAMLDPTGRKEVLQCMKELHEAGHTILMITHHVEEAIQANRILLMAHGRLLADGPAREILTDEALLEKAELLAPETVRLTHALAERNIHLSPTPLTAEEFTEAICQLHWSM